MKRFTPVIPAIVVVILAGCGAREQAHKAATAPQTPVRVSVLAVRTADWPLIYEAPGTVRATTSSTLASRVMGYVRDVKVNPGDRVKAGQVLVVIDSRDLQGVGRDLVDYVFPLTGAQRMDLVTDDDGDFYRSFEHRTFEGYRIYPA